MVKHEPVRSVDEVIDKVYAWNEGKRQFTKRQIGLAVDVLEKTTGQRLHLLDPGPPVSLFVSSRIVFLRTSNDHSG